MICQYQLRLPLPADKILRPQWGYWLYSALLEKSSHQAGDVLHRDGFTPISQFVRPDGDGICWTVSLLGNWACETFGLILAETKQWTLQNAHCTLLVTDCMLTVVESGDTLLTLDAPMRHTLTFHTATAFKRQGAYQVLPEMGLLVQSLVRRWNGAFPDLPIEDEDGEGIAALVKGLYVVDFSIHHTTYPIKGQALPGFSGTLVVENRLSGFHKTLANALLSFAPYSGVGIKTALGMGGVTVDA